ncbi:MAG: hypothetical protein R3B13_34150 [Polyangiaceae bacterium]
MTLGLFACSASSGNNGNNGTGGSGAGIGTGGTASGGSGAAVSLDGGTDATPPAVAHLQGKVFAPQGALPISGALVYLTSGSVDPIPSGVYCDRCVNLPSGVPYTFSAPDGSFNLPAYATGQSTLVVQKGQFRRVRTIDITAGDQSVATALTTLPKKTDAAQGDNIPNMAVVIGQWDAIEVSLAKLGLGQLQPGFLGLGSDVVPGSASFAMINGPDAFLSNPAELDKYQVIFIPCSGSSGTECDATLPGNATVQKNLQDWVAKGGKLYVTDYSYEYIRQSWPGYIDWYGQSSSLGSACQGDAYDAPATVKDSDMAAWLAATGVSNFTVDQSWTIIDKVNAVSTTDLDGNPATVTPKVWVEGQVPNVGVKPTTVSFVRSCGRVLFSTYHTESSSGGPTSPLLPQEAALLYVLLEVGVCVSPTVPR